MSTPQRSSSDLIRVSDAVGWIAATVRNPFARSLFDDSGNEMVDKMVYNSERVLLAKANAAGQIVRGDAVRLIDEAIGDAPDGLHPRNLAAWGTVKATIKESVWYPLAIAAK